MGKFYSTLIKLNSLQFKYRTIVSFFIILVDGVAFDVVVADVVVGVVVDVVEGVVVDVVRSVS